MRLVEWEDLEIGVFNCAGTVYAIEDRCSHDNGPLVEGELDQDACTVECPRHGSLFDLSTGKPQELPAYVPVDTFPVDRRGRHDQAGGGVTMATPETVAPPPDRERALRGHQRRLHRALRLPRRRELPVQGAQGPEPRARREDLRVQVRAAVDARVPPQGAGALPRPPDADLGLADAGRGRLRRHPLLRPRLRAGRALLGRRPRGRQEDVRPARHPRGGAQVPLRGGRAVRVRGRLPPGQRGPREAGRDLQGHGHRPA